MDNKKKLKAIRAVLLMTVVICLILIAREYRMSASHRAKQEELKEKLQVEYSDGEQEEQDRTDQGRAGQTRAEQDRTEQSRTDQDKADQGRENGTDGESAFRQGIESGFLNMLETMTDDSVSGIGKVRAMNWENWQEPEKEPVILSKYAELYEENPDLTGWLSVAGMKIDYPVMQCGDDEYYLHHDFYGNEDKYGCLYVKKIADVNTPGTNFVIYGHNMRDGSMFGDLDLYKDEAFFKEHSLISFDTLYEERTYEIVAVFLSRVYREDEDVFKYYDFYEADTPEEFQDFYENIKSMSLYDTKVTAEYGDTFITLSTCAYHVEDGRLVVVAKRVKQ